MVKFVLFKRKISVILSLAMILFTVIFILLYRHLVFGANILVTVMSQGKSHGGSFVPLLKEIVRQGYFFVVNAVNVLCSFL